MSGLDHLPDLQSDDNAGPFIAIALVGSDTGRWRVSVVGSPQDRFRPQLSSL